MMSLLFLFALVFVASAQDEKDVVVLTSDNFDDFIKNDFVLVEFYAPWCGHCKKLVPEYAAAATQLKESGSPVQLGKCDATVESDLAQKFGVRGYPTLKFFRSGVDMEYDGGRTASDIVAWVTKKSGPPSKVLATQAEIDAYLAAPGTRGLAFVDSEETWVDVAKSAKLDSFQFAHVTDAALFGDNAAGTIQLHKAGEDSLTYSGEATVADIEKFFLAEGFPLVDELAQESWTRAQQGSQDLLAIFVAADGAAGADIALEIAKAYKGDLVVTTSAQVGIAERWGSSGSVTPTAILVKNQGAEPSFSIWNEDTALEFNVDNVKSFLEESRAGTYVGYMKSEAIPEDNTAPVTIVVGKNFDDVVRQEKDVLMEFYAPWCGHCKKLAPIYEELGEAYKDDDTVVIAKMDATANGLPSDVSVQGFPTLILFNKENKQIDYDGDRDIEGFKAFFAENGVGAAAEKSEL